jgi:hypothetical protein
MSFLNLAMLTGLVAVAIPPIIHLLNRRRYDVIDWGAMQFLQISEITRRRLLIEELLLMILRMGLIAVLVLALADPFSDSQLIASGQRPNRDVVLIFDGSASMSFKGANRSAQEQAQEWATNFLGGLTPGDGVAILVARQQPLHLVPKLTTDLEKVRDQINRLPQPGGGADLARAVQTAYGILDDSTRSERDIIVLGDGQRYGWSDARSLLGWEDLASKRDASTPIKPKLWVVNLDPQRPEKPSNWALAPLTCSRAVVAVNQEILFRTSVLLSGPTKYERPHAIRVEVDGKEVKKLDPPKEAAVEGGQVPLSFDLKIGKPGSHLVTVILEPDPPAGQRTPGYVVKDHLPVDNRRDFALEVVQALPVLLVDGEEKPDVPLRASDFLRDALSPARDTSPAVKVRVVTSTEFNAAMLREGGPNQKAEERPRVLILNNVPTLNTLQQEAVEAFLNEGGGVLVTLGERVKADEYNEKFFRDNKGWLPARLDRALGDENQVAKAARPLRESLVHPALEMFRKPGIGGIDIAWFTRWWKLIPPSDEEKGSTIAKYDRQEDPFLIEGHRGDGRVIVAAVPLDNTWRTNLVDLPAYVPLLHELVYYLAGARAAEHNLEPGQALHYRLPRDASLEGLLLQSPSDPEPKPLIVGADEEDKVYSARMVEQAQGPLLIHEGLGETGIWKLTTQDRQTVYYVVQPDPREADLTPFVLKKNRKDEKEESDEEKVGKHVAFTYENDVDNLLLSLSQNSRRQFFWWWFLIGVVLLLCGEVWLTRRIVKSRA